MRETCRQATMQLDELDGPGTPFLLLKVNDKQASYLAKVSLQFTLVKVI